MLFSFLGVQGAPPAVQATAAPYGTIKGRAIDVVVSELT